MFTHKGFVALLASSAMCGGMALASGPAQAGIDWSGSQQISSKVGRAISLSEDGSIAAWIRTNKVRGSGPVRTARYRGAKKGWTKSAPIPGSVETMGLQLSGDGRYALMRSQGTGYLMSHRTSGTTWSSPAMIGEGAFVDEGQMSKSGDRVVWVDWGPDSYPSPPGKLQYRSRNTDGTWSPTSTIGTLNGDLRYSDELLVSMSLKGTSVAWVDETYSLVISTLTTAGTWSAPVKIKQFANDPYLNSLAFSAAGDSLVWSRWDVGGVFITQNTATGWSPADYAVVDDVTSAALSPNGEILAWGNDSQQMLVSQFAGGRWSKPKVLGKSNNPAIALSNRTVAWTRHSYAGTALRASVVKKGKWLSPTRLSKHAMSPSASANNRTLAWADPLGKKVVSATR